MAVVPQRNVIDAFDAARELIGVARDLAGVAQAIAQAAAIGTGARCAAVFVLREDGSFEAVASHGSARGLTRRVRPGRELLARAVSRTWPTTIESAADLPADVGFGASRSEAGISWLAPPLALVPLSCGSYVVGLVGVTGLPATAREPAARAAERLVESLAECAGRALAGALVVGQVRRAERARREIEVARRIQRRLLANTTPELPGLEVAGECRAAAQVGGDYFGFRACGDEALVATVFDVAGHGLGAAFCMTLVRSAVLGEMARGGAPCEVLRRANATAAEDLAESGLFATAFIARLDRRAGVLDYASAGHAPPIHWSARDRGFVAHRDGGLPLGLFGDSRYPHGTARFAEGDLLVITTDGVVEASGSADEPFGRHRLLALVRRLRRSPARVVLRALWREIERHVDGHPLRDDATIVVVRGTRGFGPGSAVASGDGEAATEGRHHGTAGDAGVIGARRSSWKR